ncbi:formyltransferase family protein [Lachnospiraceae bacterium 47-T17]
MGQKPIGELCFEELVRRQNDKYNVVAVVSNMDKENVWWKENGIYEQCISKNIAFIDNTKRNEEKIKELIVGENIDFIVSVGHGWILSDQILALVNYRAVNLHLAMLPEYQGNFTYNHAILNGEDKYGVTFHWMTDKVDTGDYIFTNDFSIQDNDTAYSLYLKSVDAGLSLFKQFIDYICENKELPRRSMRRKSHFYSRTSLQGLKEIQNNASLEDIARKSRAFYFPPFEGAYMVIQGEKYYVYPGSSIQ